MTSSATPTLLVVSGPAGTGKTSLARFLVGGLRLPMYSRDAIKETMFDTLGWSDRAWSRTLGQTSASVLFRLVAESLTAGVDCLVEAPFRPQQCAEDFRSLARKVAFRAVQVRCVAAGEVLVERFAARACSSERHPGHCDQDNVEEFRQELLRRSYEPLELPGPVFTVDNTTFEQGRWGRLAGELAGLLRRDATVAGQVEAR